MRANLRSARKGRTSQLNSARFEYVNEAGHRMVAAGDYTITAGRRQPGTADGETFLSIERRAKRERRAGALWAGGNAKADVVEIRWPSGLCRLCAIWRGIGWCA